MNRTTILCFLFLLFGTISRAQTNHYETVISDAQQWQYIVPNVNTSATWNQAGFDASTWSVGTGGFGFGDNDDGTIIPNGSISVYMRKSFNIIDINALTKIIFHMDYDDGFIAYINGIEIARKNLGTIGQPAPFNLLASAQHEAQLYQNGLPDQFIFSPTEFSNFLNQGTNIICVEVHNQTATGIDLSARPFLSLGLNDTTTNYNSTPNWFIPPIDFYESTLPIVILNTNFVAILDDPKIDATMGIIYDHQGGINHITDPQNEFYGEIRIERRGSSSNNFPAKSYGLETNGPAAVNYNVSIFDWPQDNDWILYAPYTDKALIRNVLTYKWGNEMGHWAPRTKLCELVLNNEYMGIYVFMERIKANPGRVPIDKLDYTDTLDNSLTGGYILKVDKLTAGGLVAWTSPFAAASPSNLTIKLQLHDPELDTIHPSQLNYIQDYFTAFENALAGPNFDDPLQGYLPFIDEQSFIDFILANEMTKNVDGYRISSYMYKQKLSEGGKLVAGPLWDFNITLGNANYCQGNLTTGWAKDFNVICSGGLDVPFWWSKLISDSVFANHMNCRWQSLRQHTLSDTVIIAYIDSMANALDSNSIRHYQRWPILGVYVWPNNFIGQTFQEEIDYLKTWLIQRLAWMDNNMFGSCNGLGINSMTTPNLLIFPNPSSDLLYIEGLQGPSSGIIMNELGQIVYHFKTNSFTSQIDISSITDGLYFIQLNQDPTIYKFIKKRL